VRPTRFGFKGLLFYLAMSGAFLASPYSNLFFLLIAFLTLHWALGLFWTLRNLSGVSAELAPIEPAPAGAGQLVRARLHAPRRARFELAVELELEPALDGRRRLRARADVAHGDVEVAIGVPPLPRGIHRLSRACVASSYPFGLFVARRPIAADGANGELVVFPAPVETAAARSGADALSEILGQGGGAAGAVQPAGLRDHRDGDEPRAVHWRASARRGALVVKEWEGGVGQGLELVLDRRCDSEALEQALSIVSAVALLARESKEVLAVHSQGLDATFGAEQRPWRELLRFLAGAEVLDTLGPAPPPVSPAVTRLPAVSRAG